MASTLASTCSNHDANMTRTDKDHNRGKKPVSQPKANTNRTRRRGTKFEDAVLFEDACFTQVCAKRICAPIIPTIEIAGFLGSTL